MSGPRNPIPPDPTSTDSTPSDARPKLPYHPPELTPCGTIRDITAQTLVPSSTDAFGDTYTP